MNARHLAREARLAWCIVRDAAWIAWMESRASLAWAIVLGVVAVFLLVAWGLL